MREGLTGEEGKKGMGCLEIRMRDAHRGGRDRDEDQLHPSVLI